MKESMDVGGDNREGATKTSAFFCALCLLLALTSVPTTTATSDCEKSMMSHALLSTKDIFEWVGLGRTELGKSLSDCSKNPWVLHV